MLREVLAALVVMGLVVVAGLLSYSCFKEIL
jgi:hypothetical protein